MNVPEPLLPNDPASRFVRRLDRPLRDPETGKMVPVGTLAVFPDSSDGRRFVPETRPEAFGKALRDVRERELAERKRLLVPTNKGTQQMNKDCPSFFARLFGRRRPSADPVPPPGGTEQSIDSLSSEQELLIGEIEHLKALYEAGTGPARIGMEARLRAKLKDLQLLNARIKELGAVLLAEAEVKGAESVNETRRKLAALGEKAQALAAETNRAFVQADVAREALKGLDEAIGGTSVETAGPTRTSLVDEFAAAGFERKESVEASPAAKPSASAPDSAPAETESQASARPTAELE